MHLAFFRRIGVDTVAKFPVTVGLPKFLLCVNKSLSYTMGLYLGWNFLKFHGL